LELWLAQTAMERA